jgi:hypothetical protein
MIVLIALLAVLATLYGLLLLLLLYKLGRAHVLKYEHSRVAPSRALSLCCSRASCALRSPRHKLWSYANAFLSLSATWCFMRVVWLSSFFALEKESWAFQTLYWYAPKSRDCLHRSPPCRCRRWNQARPATYGLLLTCVRRGVPWACLLFERQFKSV